MGPCTARRTASAEAIGRAALPIFVFMKGLSMFRTLLKFQIHRASVTHCGLHDKVACAIRGEQPA